MNALALSPQVVRLASETDFAGWRAAARALREAGVAPEAVVWAVDPARPAIPMAGAGKPFTVSREFLDLASRVVLHRSDERFDLLYRLLWRLADAPLLLRDRDDPEVARVRALAAAVEAAAPRNRAPLRPIPESTAGAETQVEMVRQTHSEPDRRTVRAAHRASRDAPFDGQAPSTLEAVWAGVAACRRCDLWRCGAGVAGEGPRHARLMFVGEQPGDQEEQAVKPFVGPAGQMLDKALAAAGVPRAETFVTNAVKHFKHELRGKRRLHKTPDAGEVIACRWWLDAERRIVQPRVIVALGATAAASVFGKAMPIAKSRQQAIQLPDQAQGVVTYHPSYLLRVPDAEAKAKAYALFVEDLKFAWNLAA